MLHSFLSLILIFSHSSKSHAFSLKNFQQKYAHVKTGQDVVSLLKRVLSAEVTKSEGDIFQSRAFSDLKKVKAPKLIPINDLEFMMSGKGYTHTVKIDPNELSYIIDGKKYHITIGNPLDNLRHLVEQYRPKDYSIFEDLVVPQSHAAVVSLTFLMVAISSFIAATSVAAQATEVIEDITINKAWKKYGKDFEALSEKDKIKFCEEYFKTVDKARLSKKFNRISNLGLVGDVVKSKAKLPSLKKMKKGISFLNRLIPNLDTCTNEYLDVGDRKYKLAQKEIEVLKAKLKKLQGAEKGTGRGSQEQKNIR